MPGDLGGVVNGEDLELGGGMAEEVGGIAERVGAVRKSGGDAAVEIAGGFGELGHVAGEGADLGEAQVCSVVREFGGIWASLAGVFGQRREAERRVEG